MRGILIIFMLRFFSWLPLWLSHAIGTGIGLCLYYTPARSRHITLTNLKLCFPEWNQHKRFAIARKSLIEAARSVTESGAIWCWKPSHIQKLVREVSGEEIYQSALKKAKGIIVLTPHLGAWEVIGLHLTLTYPNQGLTILYRPPHIPELDRLILHARERTGAKLVPTTISGVKALYHALAEKQSIGILPDQDPGNSGGVFAPFFGVSANTMALVSKLARKSGAAVIYIYVERLPRGKGFHLHFHSATDAIYDNDVVLSATAINQGIEECVRELPDQYQWSYRRFKTRPEGEAGLY